MTDKEMMLDSTGLRNSLAAKDLAAAQADIQAFKNLRAVAIHVREGDE